MKRWGHVFSIRTLLLTAFCLLILLPYGFTSVYFTLSMSAQLRSEKEQSVRTGAVHALACLDTMMQETQRLSYLPIVDAEISRILRTSHASYDTAYYQDELRMESAIKDAISINTHILSVVFYAQKGNVYQVNHLSTVLRPQDQAWMQMAQASVDGCYVAPVQENGISVRVLPVIFALYDSLDDTCIGFARVDYDMDGLIANMKEGLGEGICMVLKQNGIVMEDAQSRTNDSEIPQQTMEARAAQGENFEGTTWTLRHEKTGMEVTVLDLQGLEEHPTMHRIILYLILLGIMLLLDLIVCFLLIGHLGNSIRDLAHAMDHARHGDAQRLQIQDHALIHTELDEVRKSYNMMIQRLGESAKRETAAKLEQKNSMIKVLESQINPHFLYNTLNLIASLAELEHQETIQTVAVDLAQIFRYAIKGDSMVCVSEELRQTTAYIEILRLRFPERLDVKIDAEPEVMNARIPKLLLQPLLENAVKYGTEGRSSPLLLKVTIRRHGEDILIRVEDNGPGIAPEKRRTLQDALDTYEPGKSITDGTSIGLMNVHARVRAHAGEPFGVTIEDTEVGCTISMLLPHATTGDETVMGP